MNFYELDMLLAGSNRAQSHEKDIKVKYELYVFQRIYYNPRWD